MAPPPPHIIIIPAACQTSAFYTPLTDALSALGLSASTIVPLPSVGVNPGVPDFSADVDAIRKTVQSVLDKGTDVVVLMHSYGGLPGSAALKGLGKVAGDKGEKAGVVRVIYMCSFVLGEGGKMPGAGDAEGLKKMMGEGFDEVNMTLSISPQAAVLGQFHDLPSPAEAEHWAGQMKTQSVKALWSAQTYAAYMDIPSAYVMCTTDRIIPLQAQEEMVKNAQELQPKAFDVVERLESGHEPILSVTSQLAGVVKKAVETKGW